MAEVIIDIAERFVKGGGEPVDNGLKAVARREDRERAKKVTAFTCFGIEDYSDGRGTSIKLELGTSRVEIRQFLLSSFYPWGHIKHEQRSCALK